MKRCPFCAEEIQDAAIVCKHCGRDLPSVATGANPPLPRAGESGTPPSASANRAPTASQPLFRGMTRKKVAVAVGIALAIVVVPILAIFVMATIVDPVSSRTDDRSQSPPESNQAFTGSAANWRELASWEGSGTKQTKPFEVHDGEWRISWETRNEAFAGAGIFQIYVHNDRGELVSLAANKQGTGRDTSYVRGKGRYYLMINSGNVEWSVAVEQR